MNVMSCFFFQKLLQSEQLVAILCRFDEVQFLGRFLHELAGAVDAFLQLVFRHILYHRVGCGMQLGFRLGISLGGLRLAFGRRRRPFDVEQGIVARARNLFRRDAVCLVVGQLFSRRRLVSSMVCRILSVMWSAYMMTFPFTLRAARPAVWVSERCERRKPSLSASRMATSDTSGRSSPSRSRFTPTSTS